MAMDPIQKKLKEIEYVKTKLLSPFMTLKSPTFNYGGGYPVYSTGGSSGFVAGANYPNHATKFGASPPYYWNKPMKGVAPYHSQSLWSNKGFSGLNIQQGTANYAPNCDHTTSSWKPISVTVPLTPTYSAGTPLNSYHSSASPTQTYGTPLINFSAKSTISSTSSQSGSTVPLSQTISVPVLVSDTVVLKSSTPSQYGSYQNVNPSYYWSSAGSLPSVPSWSSTSGSLPSQFSSFTSNPTWSGTSGYFPFYSGTPQSPAGIPSYPTWAGTSGYFPVSVSGSQVSSYVPTTPSPPAWSTITPSTQTSLQSSTPVASYFSRESQYSTPSPIGQQYFVVPPTPASSPASDQGEVSITPPPAQAKSNFVSTLPGPNVVIPVDSSVYNPGSSYFGSYYPNVFYITNEQHIDKPISSEAPEQAPSSLQSTSGDTSTSSEGTPMSTETSSVLTKILPTPQDLKTPVQATYYSSSPVDQPKFTLYSIPPPVVSSNGYYSSPVQGSYPIPVSSSLLGTSSIAISQPPLSSTIPASRTRTSADAYPTPLGYRYNAPFIAFQSGFQSQFTAKTPTPC